MTSSTRFPSPYGAGRGRGARERRAMVRECVKNVGCISIQGISLILCVAGVL